MEASQIQTSAQGPFSRPSPLSQHPLALSLPPSPDATHTIFLNYPTARLSSSPATSPRIIEPHPTRRGSVYPAMSHTMEIGHELCPDFFDDDSSGSDWEDTEGNVTQTFSDSDRIGSRSLTWGKRKSGQGSLRGRGRERNSMTALPPFRQLPAQWSEFGMINQQFSGHVDGRGSERAKEMSVRRLSRDSIRLVHNRSNTGTPRGSLRSTISSNSIQSTEPSRQFPTKSSLSTELPRDDRYKKRQRSDTSDSIIAGSIIDAHVMTMRALESLNDSPSGSMVQSDSRTFSPSTAATSFPKFSSFSNHRHVTLSPLSTRGDDHSHRDRPVHLPSYFIRTPYPFTAKKEFPKPKSRPRQRAGTDHDRLDSGYDDDDTNREYNARKGKHVLGLQASEGDYDLRSRLERNKDVQGLVRSRADSGRESSSESTIWLSLSRHASKPGSFPPPFQKLVSVTIPSNLTVSTPLAEKKHKTNIEVTLDFDDAFLALRLRATYHTLAGPWSRRAFSARTLCAIRLCSTATWSGTPTHAMCPGLLAAGVGINGAADAKSPFTESSLTNLYRNPQTGKARYTWVHWARRVAESNTPTRARSLDNAYDPFRFPRPVEHGADPTLPDAITTVQFVHAVSKLRVLSVLALMLVMSVVAALLWVFAGGRGTGARTGEGRERVERVGGGMGVGVLVMLVEGVGFGAWVWAS